MRALALLVLCSPLVAHAEGESSPMVGGALVATKGADVEAGGVQLELALWHGRFGIAVEGSHQASLDGGGTSISTLGGSLRVLLYSQLIPSLLDPREDVELGWELHGIVERAWIEDADAATSYGGGLVVRLRGGTDFSNVLAESRLFVRVLATPRSHSDVVARTTMEETDRTYAIVIGLGAVFGGGTPQYARQFHARPLDVSMLPVN